MTDDPEIARWQQEWQAQESAGPDVDELRRGTAKRNRREKIVVTLELLLGGIALAICIRAFFLVSTISMQLGIVALSLIVIGATGRSLLLRRRLWRASTLSITDLITLERKRLETRVRYWRESAWVVTALWCAVAVIATVDTIQNPDAITRLEGWYLSLAVNLPVVIITVAYAWRTRRRAQNQRRLLGELEHPEAD